MNKYPGDGYYYVCCDVCGSKIRARDAIEIMDKYNYLNRMVVCKDDADKTNPQNHPIILKDRNIAHPLKIRSEPTDTFIDFETDPVTTDDL